MSSELCITEKVFLRSAYGVDGLCDDVPDDLRIRLDPAPEAALSLLTSNEHGKHVYFLVDAALRTEITGHFDLDALNLPVTCLFDLRSEGELDEAAPYLVDLALPEKLTPLTLSFHRELFAKHWTAGTGVLIATDMSMEGLREHLRHFTKLPMEEDGKRLIFRFWDPATLPHFLRVLSLDAPRARRFMMDREGTALSVLIPRAETDRLFVPDAEGLKNQPLVAMRLKYSDFNAVAHDQLRARQQRVAARIAEDFKSELNGRPQTEIEAAVVNAFLRFGRYGFTKHAYLHFFAAWTVFFGDGFEAGDPTGQLQEICRQDGDEDARFKAFRARFDSFVVSDEAA